MMIWRDALEKAVKQLPLTRHQRFFLAPLVAAPGSFVPVDDHLDAIYGAGQGTPKQLSWLTLTVGAKLRRHGFEIMVRRNLGRAIVPMNGGPA